MPLFVIEFIYLKIPLTYNSFSSNSSSGQRFDTMYVVWVEYASTARIKTNWSDDMARMVLKRGGFFLFHCIGARCFHYFLFDSMGDLVELIARWRPCNWLHHLHSAEALD